MVLVAHQIKAFRHLKSMFQHHLSLVAPHGLWAENGGLNPKFSPLKKEILPKKEGFIFQAPNFRGELLVSGRAGVESSLQKALDREGVGQLSDSFSLIFLGFFHFQGHKKHFKQKLKETHHHPSSSCDLFRMNGNRGSPSFSILKSSLF